MNVTFSKKQKYINYLDETRFKKKLRFVIILLALRNLRYLKSFQIRTQFIQVQTIERIFQTVFVKFKLKFNPKTRKFFLVHLLSNTQTVKIQNKKLHSTNNLRL
jgi:hypothetical protein